MLGGNICSLFYSSGEHLQFISMLGGTSAVYFNATGEGGEEGGGGHLQFVLVCQKQKSIKQEGNALGPSDLGAPEERPTSVELSREQSVFNQTNIGAVSRTTLGRQAKGKAYARDGPEETISRAVTIC